MRITWRSDFESTQSTERVVVPANRRQLIENPHPALDKMEHDVALMVAIAAADLATCRLGHGISEEASTFSHFLADLEHFEGGIRGLLLDTSLSRYKTTRLNRVFRAYQLLRPIGQLRRHIEFPLLAIQEHSEFIRLEISKAIEAVASQGRKAAQTMREPGWGSYLEVCAAQEQAQAVIQEARRRFRVVLTPGAYRAAQASLMALEVACETFQGIAHQHSEVLRAEVINQMGAPVMRTYNNNRTSL